MAKKFDSTHSSPTFTVGSTVMYRDVTKKSKLDPIWLGPCQIVKRSKGGAYILLDNDGHLIDRRFPPSHLKLVSPNDADEISYTVGKILKHRGSGESIEYFVSWEGYDASFNSWIPASNFNDLDVITQYHKSLPKGK